MLSQSIIFQKRIGMNQILSLNGSRGKSKALSGGDLTIPGGTSNRTGEQFMGIPCEPENHPLIHERPGES